jgi:general secretion pathway protein G
MALARTTNPAGFTLIEVTIVLIILGLLAGIVVPSVVGVLEKQQIRATEVQLKSVADALDAFRVDIGRLPTPEEWTSNILWVKPEGDDPAFANYREGGYLKIALGKDPWGFDYVYEPGQPDENGKITTFTLRSWGPNRTDDSGEPDDIVYPPPVAEEGQGAR